MGVAVLRRKGARTRFSLSLKSLKSLKSSKAKAAAHCKQSAWSVSWKDRKGPPATGS